MKVHSRRSKFCRNASDSSSCFASLCCFTSKTFFTERCSNREPYERTSRHKMWFKRYVILYIEFPTQRRLSDVYLRCHMWPTNQRKIKRRLDLFFAVKRYVKLKNSVRKYEKLEILSQLYNDLEHLDETSFICFLVEFYPYTPFCLKDYRTGNPNGQRINTNPWFTG